MDLKSANVLLQDKNYLVAKIADLGLSRQIAEGSVLTNSGHGVLLPDCISLVYLPSAYAGLCLRDGTNWANASSKSNMSTEGALSLLSS